MAELGLADGHRFDYKPSGWLHLWRILPKREVSDKDVFLDLGSGKGRIIHQAASYPFRRIIGVEISAELNRIAKSNIDRSLPRLQCTSISLITGDAADYEIPDDVTIIYIFNPFHGPVFEAFVDNLLASLGRNPRRVRLIYANPTHEARLTAAGAQLLRRTRGWRPSRSWSHSNQIRLYTFDPSHT